MTEYEVILDGGGPWGIRLQGGKDFGVALNVARVTPGSKAANKRLMAGDQILVINGQETSNLKHTDAQNLIKNAGDRLQLKLKQGKGASLGDIKTVGGGGMQAQPSQTLYTTQVTHSAGVDHKFNSKPRAFGAGDVGATTVTAKKFDPGEYARKKKEELDRYKEEQAKPAVAPDSDVLRMLQRTSISDKGAPQEHGNFSRLQTSLANEGQWKDEDQPKAEFRMTANREMSDVSPGSRVIMDDIKNRGSTGLTSSGSAAGGSKSFKYLQQLTDEDDALPPPPPELMGGNSYGNDDEPVLQSGTFNMMQKNIDAGKGDQIRTVFDQSPGQRGQPVPAPPRQYQPPVNRNTSSTVNAIPKPPMPSGPNFKVGRASAPTFKSSAQMQNQKAPPPPAVNAGEIQNPNSRLLSSGSYPSSTSPPTSPSGRNNYSSPPQSGGSGYTSPNARNTPQRNSPSGGGAQTTGDSGKDLQCNACQQHLDGPFVSAIGKTWHPEHFCCSACNLSLQNQAFVEENNQLFCEKCYNQYYAPKCAHCNNAIIGNCVNALGKSWHPDHFICSFCSKSFGNEGFLVDSGRPYCGKCFEDLFSVKCGKCAKPITGGEKYVEALNKNWHSTCFTCNQCSTRLEGNSFFVSKGMPYCQNHKAGN